MSTPFVISVTRHSACTTITVAGELDRSTLPRLERAAEELLRDGQTRLIFHLTPLEFCDSSGLRFFLTTDHQARRAGGWTRLAGLHGSLQRVLELTGLERAFQIDETLEQALAHATVVDDTS
jgi:anti-sigma B factor antagonist